MIDVILQAFASIVLDPVTLGLMLIGTLAGILAGAIPGFTIAMGVILTLPFTFGMSPIQGLATMLGVFVGGFSGGLMSCMLTGIPGTPSSVATTFDGFPLVRSGRPGLALGLGLWSSFFGGMISAVILVALGLERPLGCKSMKRDARQILTEWMVLQSQAGRGGFLR